MMVYQHNQNALNSIMPSTTLVPNFLPNSFIVLSSLIACRIFNRTAYAEVTLFLGDAVLRAKGKFLSPENRLRSKHPEKVLFKEGENLQQL